MPRGAKQRPERIAYTVNDAAAALGVSEHTIRRALDVGQLPAHLIFGEGYPRILKSDLVGWLRTQPRYEPKALM